VANRVPPVQRVAATRVLRVPRNFRVRGVRPEFRFRPRERRRPSRMTVGVVLAVVLAVAALVVAVVSLVTQPAPAPTVSAPSGQAITDADKALCQAIGPLMKENDDRSNAFLTTGEAGSPERDAALPKFVSDNPRLGAPDATGPGCTRQSATVGNPRAPALHR